MPRQPRVVLLEASGPRARPADPWGAANLALAVRSENERAWIMAAAGAVRQASSSPPEGAQPAASAPRAGVDWQCVAVAETGGDFTMHGATYSTAYGVINDIVREYASPEVAARVFAGTASESEQTDIVARFAAENGTGGWGTLTKQKCGL